MALIVPRHTGEMKYIMTAMEVYSNHGDWLSNDDFIDRQSRKLIAEGYDSVINSDRTHYTKDAELVRYFGFAERKVQGDKYSDVRLTSQGEEFLTAWKNSNMDECQELIMQALEHVTFGRNNEGCGSDSNVEAPKVCVMSSLILDGITKKELAYILDALDRGVSYSQILITIIQCRILGKNLPPYTVTEDQKYVQFMRNIGFFDDTQDSRGIIIKLSKSVRSRFLDRIKHLSLYNNEELKFITNENYGNDLFCSLPLQKISYGAPGTGKSHGTNEVVRKFKDTIRTTFHPDSDYSTFVGSYKPTTTKELVLGLNGTTTVQLTDPSTRKPLETTKIVYKFIKQAFLKAYILAWKKMCNARVNTQIQPNSIQKPIILSHTNGSMQWEVTKIDDLSIYLTATEVYDKEKFKKDVELVWKTCWNNNTYQPNLTTQNRPQICVCNWMAELQNPDFEFCWEKFLAELSKGEMELNVDLKREGKPYFFCIDSDNNIKLTRDVSGKKETVLNLFKEDKGSTNYQQAVANYLKEQYKSFAPNEAWDKLKDVVKGTTTSSTTLTDSLADIRQFLVIEEINRGNCAQIFGDLFQLLDRKNGYSEYPIEADEDIQKALLDENPDDGLSFGKDGLTLPEQVKNELRRVFEGDANPDAIIEKICMGKVLALPSNLHIWATMNTSDQSLFPIDSAFKRRWDWEYKPIIKPADKNWEIQVGPGYDWWTFLEEVNKIINELTSSEDKKLGYFFAKAKKVGDKDVVDIDTMVNKVFFYLWNDVFKDYDLGHLQSFPKIKEDTSKTDSKEKPYSFGDFFDKVKGEISKKAVEDFMKAFMPNTATTATATTAAGTTPQETTEQTTE